MPAQAIRFRVCDLDRSKQACSWGIYANAKTNDIYIVPRNLGQSIKISLHESGSWRLAYLNDFFDEKVEPLPDGPQTRVIDEWTRPRQIGGPWQPALKIITPHTSINSDLDAESNIININTSESGVAIEVQIHVNAETFPLDGPIPHGLNGLRILRSFPLDLGERVYLSCRKTRVPDFSSVPKASARPFHGETLEPLPNRLRMLLFADDQDGNRCFYDLVNQE